MSNIAMNRIMLEALSSCKVINDCESVCGNILVWLKRPNVCSKMLSCCTIEPLHPDTNNFYVSADTKQKIPLGTIEFFQTLFQLSKQIKCLSCHGVLGYDSDQSIIPKLYLRKLVPRRHDIHRICYELVCESKNCFVFIPLHFETLTPSEENNAYLFVFTNTCSAVPMRNNCDYWGFGCLTVCVLSQDEALKNGAGEMISATPKNDISDCFVTKTWLIKNFFQHWAIGAKRKTNPHLKQSFHLLYHCLIRKNILFFIST